MVKGIVPLMLRIGDFLTRRSDWRIPLALNVGWYLTILLSECITINTKGMNGKWWFWKRLLL